MLVRVAKRKTKAAFSSECRSESSGSHCHSREDFTEACLQALRDQGCRITKPRRAIITCLAASDAAPLTARELFQAIAEDKSTSTVDQVSVYRTLEVLESLGLIHQVFPSGGYLACFHRECSPLLHLLIRCSACEEIRELDMPRDTLAPMLRYLERSEAFYPDDHHLQLNGLCQQCREIAQR